MVLRGSPWFLMVLHGFDPNGRINGRGMTWSMPLPVHLKTVCGSLEDLSDELSGSGKILQAS